MDRDAGVTAAGPFPIRLSSFVGRVEELRDVREALERHRLVTLVGPGGAGKTRLAVEAARAWSGGQRWYVDLAPVDDDAAVEPALAVATGAPEGPGEDPLDAAARRIGAATGLILVDNGDQVVDGCAKALDVLLRSCPGLLVLATSREPLRVEGELIIRLPPLSLPAAGERLDGDAVRLFLDRANLSPDTGLRDWSGIRQICERLDGMPLAIELAAARVAALSVPDILAGLDDRFRLLADGPRTADRRQRSLAASIHWSYRMLTEAEAVVLQRLAVLRSPFTAETATAVVAGDPVAEPEVLALLARLVEKSFVVIDERDEVARYRLLETIREYAAARLEANPADAAATRDRHLRSLRHAVEQADLAYRRLPPLEWLDRFESELPDIRAAVAWAARTGNADDALRLVGSLSRFWWVRARADGGRVIEQALAIEGGEPRWRAYALTAATMAALARSDVKAIEFGREATRCADRCDDPALAARAYGWLGWTYVYLDPARARSPLDRARELARDADDPTQASVLNALVATELGKALPVARSRAEEALALASRHDNRVDASCAHLWLAFIAMMRGDLPEVESRAGRALSLAEEMGSILFVGYARFLLAQHALMVGDGAAAARHAEAVAEAAEAGASPALRGYATAVKALVNLVEGRVDQVRGLLERAIPDVSIYPRGVYASWLSDILTDVALGLGEPEAAQAYAARALEHAEEADSEWGRSRGRLASARVNAYLGEVHAARRDIDQALDRAGDNDDLMTRIEGLELLAQLDHTPRDTEYAVRCVAAARAVRARTGYVRPLTGGSRAEALIDELRGQLGDQAFDRAWADGGALTLDDAVALARRGRGRRGRPSAGWDGLTPAERRVVALVGEGLTNPQIASRLFVSPDTVKGHVSAALRKLGVANRAELAAEAARRGERP